MKFNLAKRTELGMFFENMFLLARAVAGVGGGGRVPKRVFRKKQIITF